MDNLQLQVLRYSHKQDSTGGLMLIEDQFFCYTVEDEFRDEKVSGETRIPNGRYEIKFRPCGGMNEKYQARYPQFHKGMLWLQDVPGFEWIYMHTGITDDHTEGCILVGDTASLIRNENELRNSADAYTVLYQFVAAKLMSGGRVFITVDDVDLRQHLESGA